MRAFALAVVLSTPACSEADTTRNAALDAAVDDAQKDSALDAGPDSGVCCPIGNLGCCMDLGGSRGPGGFCPSICDSIPTDFVVRTDDAGCPYWYDPPGGSVTCTFIPPDTGTPDVLDTD